ncbi:MAG: hypothetical protein DHS20C04_30410 [Hyphococcus sp.]|nr:MAG: hypothetical protein DHS20C04_30410 [Marinicaulis sp.]
MARARLAQDHENMKLAETKYGEFSVRSRDARSCFRSCRPQARRIEGGRSKAHAEAKIAERATPQFDY